MDTAQALPAIPWRGENVSRIILGTVQLGMDYGIANTQGKPDLRKARAIVETAWIHGIRHFDTAQGYEESEGVLGAALRDIGVIDEARIVSKLSTKMNPRNIAEIRASIERTFERLGCNRLWCMMLHDPAWLDAWDDGLGDLLRNYQRAGRIQYLGASLTCPETAPQCLAHPDMAVLQLACNAWDRRMLRLGILDAARRNGQLACVRSIYLQGLLTMPPDRAAARLPAAAKAAAEWHALAGRCNMAPVDMAMGFALGLEAPLVVGAESPDQIEDTVRRAQRGPMARDIANAVAEALDPVVSEAVLDPRQWHTR